MRSCGKRSFTLECKAVDRGLARRRGLKTGRPGFLLGRFFGWRNFLFCGGGAVFSGGFGKNGCFCVVFLW
jgi:hypothetical protein